MVIVTSRIGPLAIQWVIPPRLEPSLETRPVAGKIGGGKLNPDTGSTKGARKTRTGGTCDSQIVYLPEFVEGDQGSLMGTGERNHRRFLAWRYCMF